MARKAMVTRTIKSKVYDGYFMNNDTLTVSVREYVASDDLKPAKIIKDFNDKDTAETMVKLVYREEREELYGMYEEDFMRYAVRMNSRFEKI